MKNLLFISILFTSMTLISFSCSQKKNYWLKSGSTLTYHLVNGDNQYDFIVDNLKIDKEVSFKWTMGEPVNNTGSVTMSSKALGESTKIVNYFSDGATQNMEEETTVWLSRKIYEQIKNKKPIDISIDGTTEILNFKNNEKLKIKADGADEEVNVLYAETESGNKLWILDEPQNPLIIKMQVGFTIELISVSSGK